MAKRWKPKTELEFVALRESGHAVVAAASGCTVRRVIVTQEGEVRIGANDYRLPPISFRPARAMEIGILCEGKVAENVLGGRESSHGILKDEHDIRDQLDQLAASGSPEVSEKEILSHCQKRATEIIQLNKHVVLKLAELLATEGVAEGSELQSILKTVRTPKP